jgi:hypothetical protein
VCIQICIQGIDANEAVFLDQRHRLSLPLFIRVRDLRLQRLLRELEGIKLHIQYISGALRRMMATGLGLEDWGERHGHHDRRNWG